MMLETNQIWPSAFYLLPLSLPLGREVFAKVFPTLFLTLVSDTMFRRSRPGKFFNITQAPLFATLFRPV